MNTSSSESGISNLSVSIGFIGNFLTKVTQLVDPLDLGGGELGLGLFPGVLVLVCCRLCVI